MSESSPPLEEAYRCNICGDSFGAGDDHIEVIVRAVNFDGTDHSGRLHLDCASEHAELLTE